MLKGVPTKVIAASMGLSGFAVAVIAGLAVDNPADSILSRALIAMAACHVVGWVVGAVGERAINEALDALEVNASSDPQNQATTGPNAAKKETPDGAATV